MRTRTPRARPGRRLSSTMVRLAARRMTAPAKRGRRSGNAGLAGLTVLPERLTAPLRRDGVDPVPEIGRRRQVEPVSRLTRMFGVNVWLVSGYEEARAVLADTSSYSNDIRPLTGIEGNTAAQSIGGLGFTDPPDHTRLRKFLTPEFTRRRLARLQPEIDRIVEQRLDAMESAGAEADLVRDFAFPVPFSVICELLGLRLEDRARFQQLGVARFDVSAGGVGTFGAMSRSREFLLGCVRQQRTRPGDGLIGGIICEHGDEIDDVDLSGLADGVFTGGYETSASMLALGTLTLLRNPDAYAMIGTDPDAADRIVEELLRYLTVVQVAFPRFARHDLDLFGTPIRAGDVVVCSLSGANRDEALRGGTGHGRTGGTSVPSPERFDPHRQAAHTHLAFGHGMHRCVGAELARMELRSAFRGLVGRFPDLELAVEPDRLRFRELSIVYGLDSLPVRLGGGPRPAASDARAG